jgi:hypothetical protein
MRTNSIRSLAFGVVFLSTLAFGSSRLALAQAVGQPIAAVPPFQLDFDEAGNSLLNGLPNPNQVVFVGGGGIQYFLPGIVQPGQILINSSVDVDPLNITGDSDLLTFSNGPDLNGALTGILLYESLIDLSDPLMAADVARLNYTAPIQSIAEVGPEGANGFSYVVPGAIYNGVSDGLLVASVPEPSTWIMSAVAFLGLIVLTCRRYLAKSHALPGLVAAPTKPLPAYCG